MLFLNAWDIEETVDRFNYEMPNLQAGAAVLYRLMCWANSDSDGWHSWSKPARAAKSLMELLESAERFNPVDVADADLAKALRPIKAFLTRQGVPHEEVLG